MRSWAAGFTLAGMLVASAVASVAAAFGDEKRAIVAGDQAAARSMVIVQADTPGWRAFAKFPSGSSSNTCPNFKPDRSGFTITGERLGNQFAPRTGKTNQAFTTAAIVYASEADAKGEWRIDTSRASVACQKSQISGAARGTLSFVEESAISLPRLAPRQFARRFHVLSVGTVGIEHIYGDVIRLGRGRAEVTLLAQRIGSGSDDAPFPAAYERKLVSLLAKRLLAQSR